MKKTVTLLTLCLTSATVCLALAGETVEPFNGQDLSGWHVKGSPSKSKWTVGTAKLDPADPSKIIVTPGGHELINAKAHSTDIYTDAKFGDARIELEVMVPRHSNSAFLPRAFMRSRCSIATAINRRTRATWAPYTGKSRPA